MLLTICGTICFFVLEATVQAVGIYAVKTVLKLQSTELLIWINRVTCPVEY